MRKRRITKALNVGDVVVGGDAPITVQSMTKTDTRNVAATVDQIKGLEDVGCEIIRCAVPDMEAAKALAGIKKRTNIPLIADIHFHYQLALEALESGVDCLRLNPGNIRDRAKVETVVNEACEKLSFYPRFSNQVESYDHLGGMQSFGDTFASRIGAWVDDLRKKTSPSKIDAKAADALRADQGNGLFRNIDYDGNNVSLTNLFALEGDADGDIDIDITDFNILASNFDDTGGNAETNNWTTADFDADGDIDITDFNFLASNFAPDGYGMSAVPEPSAFLLASLAVILLGSFSLLGRHVSSKCLFV